MKKFIYESEFKSGPGATKKQQMLFNADLEYATSEGYEYIQMSTGQVFFIVPGRGIAEVDVTEEQLQADAIEAKEPVEDVIDSNYCVHCHNLMLIDEVINNTLSQKEAITPQQADTMLKLAKLRQMLEGDE